MRAAALFVAAFLGGGAGPYKLSTWNLNWLTSRPTGDADLPDDVRGRHAEDFARLRAFADHLGADAVAFEEVDGTAAAARVFDPATYTLLTIDEDVVQRVGLAVRRGIIVQRHADLAGAGRGAARAAQAARRAGMPRWSFQGALPCACWWCISRRGASARGWPPAPGRNVRCWRPRCRYWRRGSRGRARAGEAFAVMGDFNREMGRAGRAGRRVAGGRADAASDAGPQRSMLGRRGVHRPYFPGRCRTRVAGAWQPSRPDLPQAAPRVIANASATIAPSPSK